jgi:hypothetical protein
MLDLQDAERTVRLDFEADTIVSGAKPKVGRPLQPLHIAFTVVAISSQDLKDSERLFAIDLA